MNFYFVSLFTIGDYMHRLQQRRIQVGNKWIIGPTKKQQASDERQLSVAKQMPRDYHEHKAESVFT